jgi:O-6-methylguanine DNA methyltransferase
MLLATRIEAQHMTARDYDRVEQAIQYLERRHHDQPNLEEIAEHIGLSQSHFQRLFQRWAGISPKRFVQFLTWEDAKQRLSESASVLDATFDTGLSSPGRLHNLFVKLDAVTSGEHKTGGSELHISYGFHAPPFGEAFFAVTTYGALAKTLGNDRASRAVGAAVGQNMIGFWIPCHRAIQSSGIAHRYRWDTARKKAMLGWEADRVLEPE